MLPLKNLPARTDRFGAVVWPGDPGYENACPVHPDDKRRDGAGLAAKAERAGIDLTIKLSPRRHALPIAVVSNSVESLRSRIRLRLASRPDIVPNLLSINALRIVLAMLFRVRAKWDKAFLEFTTNAADLASTIGLKYRLTREQARTLLAEVLGTRLTIREGGRETWINAMSLAGLDETGGIRLKLNPDMKPYLLGLQANYHKLYPSMLQLVSGRAVLLYMLLRKYVGLPANKGQHRIAELEIRRAIQSPKSDWWRFERDILKPAIREINKTTELRVRYKPQRQGRTDRKRGPVDTVIFSLKEKPRLESKRHRLLPITDKETPA